LLSLNQKLNTLAPQAEKVTPQSSIQLMKNKIESAREIDLCRRAFRKDVQRAGLERI
jgi:hypothetical protein